MIFQEWETVHCSLSCLKFNTTFCKIIGIQFRMENTTNWKWYKGTSFWKRHTKAILYLLGNVTYGVSVPHQWVLCEAYHIHCIYITISWNKGNIATTVHAPISLLFFYLSLSNELIDMCWVLQLSGYVTAISRTGIWGLTLVCLTSAFVANKICPL